MPWESGAEEIVEHLSLVTSVHRRHAHYSILEGTPSIRMRIRGYPCDCIRAEGLPLRLVEALGPQAVSTVVVVRGMSIVTDGILIPR